MTDRIIKPGPDDVLDALNDPARLERITVCNVCGRRAVIDRQPCFICEQDLAARVANHSARLDQIERDRQLGVRLAHTPAPPATDEEFDGL
jgi:hypothetical protein